ncbi:helix-turn-helix domain-containing protein [Peribacillus simplex]|uniref:helix-turn-helix domain-containing protein n=1 Tax=Peribacillus simplex TaxID=1478 RepID=UPI003D9C08E8
MKKTIVDLSHSGNSVNELSGEYGVSEVTIYKWVKGEGTMTPKELAILKENLRLSKKLKSLKSYGHIREKVTETYLTAINEGT